MEIESAATYSVPDGRIHVLEVHITNPAPVLLNRVARVSETVSIVARIEADADHIRIRQRAETPLIVRCCEMTAGLQMEDHLQSQTPQMPPNVFHRRCHALPRGLVG